MANNPKKAKDPTAAAMSAIQEALSVRGADFTSPAPRTAKPPKGPKAQSAEQAKVLLPDVTPPEPQDRIERPALAVDVPPVPEADIDRVAPVAPEIIRPARPANDDQQSVRQILQVLQPRFNRVGYAAAAAVSVLWVGIAYFFGSAIVPGLTPLSATALIVGPVLFIFAVAHMMERARELRMISQSMAEVAMRLSEPEGAAREAIVTVSQAVRRELAAMGDGVERALARAAELEALVHGEVSALERAYHDNEIRIRGLLKELEAQRDHMAAQTEQVRGALSTVHFDLNRDLGSVGEIVATKVNAAADEITRALAQKGEQITVAIGHVGESMIATIGNKGGDVLDRLERVSEQTTRAFDTAAANLSTRLDHNTEHVSSGFERLVGDLAQNVQSRLAGVTEAFEQRSLTIADVLAARSHQITSEAIDASNRIAEAIVMRGDEVNSTLKATGDSLAMDLTLRGSELVSKLTKQTNAVADSFQQNADSVAATIAARLQNVQDVLNRGGTEIVEKIAKDSTNLGNLITRNISEFDRTVKDYGGELVQRLGDRTANITDAMRTYIDSFDERVTAKTSETTAAIDDRLSRFQDALDTRTVSLNEALGARVLDIAKTLSNGGKDVIATLEKRIVDINDAINARSATLTDSVSAKIAEVDKTLGARAVEVANNLDTRIGRFEELLVGRAEKVTEQIETRTRAAAELLNTRAGQLAETIKTNAAEAERSLSQLTDTTTESIRRSAKELESATSGVTRSFVDKADEIQTIVSQRTTEITNVLDSSGGKFLTALTEKSREFTNEVGRATDNAVKAIESKGFDFTRTMLDNSGEIARQINLASETAVQNVNSSLRSLESAAVAAVAKTREASMATVAEIGETDSTLRANGAALFDKLREANAVLHELVNQAHDNMVALETTLPDRVAQFAAAWNDAGERSATVTNDITVSVETIKYVTSTALVELGDLAKQFETHGRVLAQSVDAIDTSNRRTENSVEARRSQVEKLLETLDAKTDDLQGRLTRFNALLQESLDAATGRAREVAKIVSDASAEGARAVSQQFESVRAATEKERKQTHDALEKIYEQALGDTQGLFRQSTERFTQVVDNIKQMTGEITRELDATRAELRRGVLELPEETTENAAQMRRVIVDQIDALAELNRLVSRYGKGNETEEQRRLVREPAFQAAGAGAMRQERARTQPRAETTASAPAAQVPQSAEAPSLSPAQNGRGSNWLTDVLHRASRSEPEVDEAPARKGARQPRHMIESLDALSVDITRMMDHDAATELWDRYNRGERNVFTRKLYTLQGQKAFDEIRSRYRSDREFKQTVDHYMAEFERLLEDASRDPRGEVVVRTYLTSETGKVYTMLAHATGRFD